MFTDIKYDLERLLEIAKKDSISISDMPNITTKLGELLKIDLYYAREDGINWELLLSILLEFVLFFEELEKFVAQKIYLIKKDVFLPKE